MTKLAGSIRTFSNFYESSRSTIYALATGNVRTALAVIRVSGPNCKQVLKALGRYDSDSKLPGPRLATLRKLYDPRSRYMLDHGILLWFPGPNSYTGEDCCEFHVHGGSAVITGILKSMGNIPGCRMAEHGEFTKRAFLNGKMDLTEVDGLADLIEAETEMQRIQALKQLSGALSKIYEGWRQRIAKILAHSEAFIDFGEDENMESGIMVEVESEARSLVQEIKSHLQDSRRGERLRTGVRIAIIGKPNAGKSSLLNLLCRRDAAIVSNIPGTTRDVIESCINLRGFPVIFADTAGIRPDSKDLIEAEGIRRSKNQVKLADIVILLLDASDETSNSYSLHSRAKIIEHAITFEDEKCVKDDDINRKIEQKTIIVVNKVDLTEQIAGLIFAPVKNNNLEMETQPFDSIISCKSLQGFDAFCDLITSRVSKLCGDPKEDSPCVTQERYRSELESCVQSLELYLERCSTSVAPQNYIPGAGDLALRTNHLKNAISSIGAITGHYGSEEILDIVFRDFCIGK